MWRDTQRIRVKDLDWEIIIVDGMELQNCMETFGLILQEHQLHSYILFALNILFIYFEEQENNHTWLPSSICIELA